MRSIAMNAGIRMNGRPEYYWIRYDYFRGGVRHYEESAISIHPFKFMKKLREATPPTDVSQSLVDWKKITQEEYKLYYGDTD